jgi:hypothetical protein
MSINLLLHRALTAGVIVGNTNMSIINRPHRLSHLILAVAYLYFRIPSSMDNQPDCSATKYFSLVFSHHSSSQRPV